MVNSHGTWTPALKVLGTVFVIGAILTVLYYFFLDPYISRVLQFKVHDMTSALRGSSPELTDAVYLLSPKNGGGIYEKGSLMYNDYISDGSIVMDIARRGFQIGKIVYRPATRTYEVVVGAEKLFTSANLIRNISLSRDGQYVSFSVVTANAVAEGSKGWIVHAINLSSKEDIPYEGFAGLFLNETAVLLVRDTGVSVVDVVSRKERVLLDIPVYAAYPSISVSADGSVVGWTTLSGLASVYEVKVDGKGGMYAIPIATFNDIVGTIALTKKNLFVVSANKQKGTDITGYDLNSHTKTWKSSLPSILSLAKLVP